MTLCIAAPSFNLVSETFIRDHIRSIAPGSTILLCQDASGAEQFGYPVLSDVHSWPSALSSTQRIINSVRYRWQRYVDPSLLRTDQSRVREFLRTHHTKSVLAEYGPMGCLLARTCDDADVSLYVHFHGYDASMLLRDSRHVRHYRALFRKAVGIIAPSRFLADKLAAIGCSKGKLHICPYGIDAQRFRPGRHNGQRLIAVGRFVEKKAPDLTIEAFARIAHRFPEARLDMIGDGPLVEKCRALICEFGLNERVNLHGAQGADVVARFMQEGALFVQHSVTAANGDTEGFPVAILEAMASALPVVSTRHSGIPEAVQDNVTGLLVNENDVDGMANAMAELLGDPGRAIALGVAGRKRILSNFTQKQARDRLRCIMGFPPLSNAPALADLPCDNRPEAGAIRSVTFRPQT